MLPKAVSSCLAPQQQEPSRCRGLERELQLTESCTKHWTVLCLNALDLLQRWRQRCPDPCLDLARADAGRLRGVSAAAGAVSCGNAGGRSWVWLQGQCWEGGDAASFPQPHGQGVSPQPVIPAPALSAPSMGLFDSGEILHFGGFPDLPPSSLTECLCSHPTGMSLLLALLPTGGHKAEPSLCPLPALKCRTGPLDIVFVIDSSRSVRPFEFETMRRFMMDIISNLDVGPNATRVGVIQYSSQVQNIFSLKTFFTRADMEKAINSIIPLAQGTMTGLAIQYAMNVAFTTQEGARPLHKKIPRIAIIVTDGRPQDRVTEVATQARNAGIEIYAVGIQRADMNSLRAMASPPLEEHVFLVESFELIQQFGKQFQDKLCGG